MGKVKHLSVDMRIAVLKLTTFHQARVMLHPDIRKVLVDSGNCSARLLD